MADSQTTTSPHRFHPLRLWDARGNGRCKRCLLPAYAHPIHYWAPARPLGDKRKADLSFKAHREILHGRRERERDRYAEALRHIRGAIALAPNRDAACKRVTQIVSAALDDQQAACDFCGQTEGHSKRCSVTKFGVNPKPPYTDAPPRELHREDQDGSD